MDIYIHSIDTKSKSSDVVNEFSSRRGNLTLDLRIRYLIRYKSDFEIN